MVILNALYNLQYNIYNNNISITLPYAGTYECDVSIIANCTPGLTADCGVQYCISTNSTTPDSVVNNIVGAYTIGTGQQKKLSRTYI